MFTAERAEALLRDEGVQKLHVSAVIEMARQLVGARIEAEYGNLRCRHWDAAWRRIAGDFDHPQICVVQIYWVFDHPEACGFAHAAFNLQFGQGRTLPGWELLSFQPVAL